MTRQSFVTAGLGLMLAVTTPAPARAKDKGHKSTPPGSTPLPSPTVSAPAVSGAVPFAWIDDASVLPPGVAAMSIAVQRWQGADLSEVDVPVVGFALGVAQRVQLGASIPRVMGSNDPTGVIGGFGTTFVSAKVAVLQGTGSNVKLAVAPTVEILGDNALQALAPGDGRTQFGLPVSLEIDRGGARVFASAGYFSTGAWFAGGGIGGQVSRHVTVSGAFSRAWATDATGTIVHDRRDLSGGAAFTVTPRLALFGSVGTTVATTAQDGAGTTVSGGVLVLFPPGVKH